MAKNRAVKRKAAGGMTRNQKRKAAYATQSGWKHGKKGSRQQKGRARLVGGLSACAHARPTNCPRSCRSCYPGGVFTRVCPRGTQVWA